MPTILCTPNFQRRGADLVVPFVGILEEMSQTTPNHTQTVAGWAAHDSSLKVTPFVFKRRYESLTHQSIISENSPLLSSH